MRFKTFAIAGALVAGQALAQSNEVASDLEIRDADGAMTLSATWLAARAGDFGAKTLIADPSRVPDSRHFENAPVHFAWPLQPGDDASAGVQSARVESRQYWVDTTGAKLGRGVELPLSARGAVIRVSPLETGGDIGIDPARVQLSLDGKRLDSAESLMRQVTDGASLKRQGMSVPDRTIAFKLDKSVPPGTLQMRVGGMPGEQHLVVHVFEPESDWVAELTLPARNVFAGEQLAFGYGLGNGDDRVTVDSVQAVLADPFADRTWALDNDAERGTLKRRAPGDRFVSGQQGLFEAYVYLETERDGVTIRRDLKLPVSIVPPLARFDGRVEASSDAGLRLALGIESAVAGRFQVNGRVYGTAADGSMKPLALAQAAATVDRGNGRITLEVDRATVAASGLSAPFEVRNLELLDQGRMYLLQKKQRGVLLTP